MGGLNLINIGLTLIDVGPTFINLCLKLINVDFKFTKCRSKFINLALQLSLCGGFSSRPAYQRPHLGWVHYLPLPNPTKIPRPSWKPQIPCVRGMCVYVRVGVGLFALAFPSLSAVHKEFVLYICSLWERRMTIVTIHTAASNSS